MEDLEVNGRVWFGFNDDHVPQYVLVWVNVPTPYKDEIIFNVLDGCWNRDKNDKF